MDDGGVRFARAHVRVYVRVYRARLSNTVDRDIHQTFARRAVCILFQDCRQLSEHIITT